jgi:translation elongation factor EF-Tu-like GTPase
MPLLNLRSSYAIAGILALLFFSLPIGASAGDNDGFSMKIMDVFAITGRGTVLTGQVATGSVAVGDLVCVPLQNGETAALGVDGIEMFRKVLDRAEQGQMVGILVDVDKKQVQKGALLHGDCKAGGVAEKALNPTGT